MKYLISIFIIISLSISPAFSQPQQIDQFIQQMVNKHGFTPNQLQTLLSPSHYKPEIITAINHPYEQVPWYQYQQHFLTPQRIQAGVQFCQKFNATLERAEKEYGVPKTIIAAIIGVESLYGKNLGQYSVLDSLYTLSFYETKRAKFFQAELEQFLLLTRENKIDPHSPRGSYAGAIGQPQFMPSSYRQYAVDYNQDGQKDLTNDVIDTIGSIANYLHKKGWNPQEKILLPAQVTGKAFLSLNPNELKPTYSANQLTEHGIIPQNNVSLPTKASFLILATSKNNHEYWLGLPNFSVIRRYNVSVNYAMAVYQLSEAIQKNYPVIPQKT